MQMSLCLWIERGGRISNCRLFHKVYTRAPKAIGLSVEVEKMELPTFLTRHQYGEIRLTGHRIGLFHIAERYQQGMTAEAIAQEFPSIPLELVEKTIAFYEANRAEVEAYIAANRAELDRQEAEPSVGPDIAELRRRMQARKPRPTK
jgi:uncharacterized protein (DUF433 family)